jgi:hypothetical protein
MATNWRNKMTTEKTTDITFRVYNVGSNMPGYMPDEPPHPHASFDDARESLLWDIGRDIDDIASGEWSHEGIEQMAQLARFAEYCRNCDPSEIGGTVGNRHYFIAEDTMTGQELEDRDCDPSEYEPILDEWIEPDELDALERYGVDLTIIEAEYRYRPDSPDSDVHKLKQDDIVDDYGSGGKWYVGKVECGPWILPSKVIRADSWENAWGAYIDECSTVPDDELHEAYGYDSRAEFQQMIDDVNDGAREWPDLSDEYEHQSNASDTGIVYSGDRTVEPVGVESHIVRFKVSLD